MKSKKSFIALAFILGSLSVAHARKPKFLYTVDPSEVKVEWRSTESMPGLFDSNDGFIDFYVGAKKIATDRFKGDVRGYDSHLKRAGIDQATSNAGPFRAGWKADHFEEILKIAKKYNSKVKIYEAGDGYKWIEPVDAAALAEVKKLADWDRKKDSKVHSVKKSLVTISSQCSAQNGANLIDYKLEARVFIAGQVYHEHKFSSEEECEKEDKRLQELLKNADSEFITMYPGKKDFLWIEAIKSAAVQDEGTLKAEKEPVDSKDPATHSDKP